jgi:hypothetical protein
MSRLSCPHKLLKSRQKVMRISSYTNLIACCDRRAEIVDLLKRTRIYKAARLSFRCDVTYE